ncbi:MAG: CRISPR-associated endonuclease Cas2 [Planctomycetes bacterium]|nr:CRISPR-associated endonuclease Cas2 [Planctomycetota bacterium]
MWLFALFDLPMITKDDRRRYTKFRKVLLQHGFTKLQYSVYAQYCPSEDASLAKRRTIRGALPPDGQVRLVSITDKQFGAMEVFLGKTSAEPEEPLGQGLLF